MNPAYMIRQINEQFTSMYDDYIHITSLRPLHKNNQPDAWERKSLASFIKESDEIAEIVSFRGEDTLRLMRPMVTKTSCLKCHEDHGYRLGDIRGGVSIAVPMKPYRAKGNEQLLLIGSTHGVIWFCGLIGIVFYTLRARQHIEDKRAAIVSLQEASRYNHSVISAMGEGVLGFDRQARLTFINHQGERLLGWRESELIGNPIHPLIHDHHGETTECTEDNCPILGVMQSRLPYQSEDDHFYTHQSDALPVSYIATPLFVKGEVSGGVLAFKDITVQKQALQSIEYLAHHDSLTGLPNRASFINSLSNNLAHAQRYEHRLALMFLDLDNFGIINDTAGHAVGDELLQQVAKRLRNQIRSPDLIARQGGDEFFILLVPDINQPPSHEDRLKQEAERSVRVAKRMLEALRSPFNIAEHEFYIKASIGISLYPDDAKDQNTLMRNADSAMYFAKNSGRDGYMLFSGELSEIIVRRHKIENALNQALENQEFHLKFQPLVNLDTGVICGVEALLRWHSAVLGKIPPTEFIPISENNGLIIPIGQWVIQQACEQLAQWQKIAPQLTISINVSARQFQRGDLFADVLTTAEKTGIPLRQVELEITESAIMHAPDKVIHTLNNLHQQGVQLSLDDFGTGYSSLSRLKHLPVTTMKIDKSFVDGIPNDPDDVEIVHSTIQLSKNLNKSCLAEGIETELQWKHLLDQGCQRGQGFYFSRPATTDAITTLLLNGGHWKEK